jgi:hypothetical protein
MSCPSSRLLGCTARPMPGSLPPRTSSSPDRQISTAFPAASGHVSSSSSMSTSSPPPHYCALGARDKTHPACIATEWSLPGQQQRPRHGTKRRTHLFRTLAYLRQQQSAFPLLVAHSADHRRTRPSSTMSAHLSLVTPHLGHDAHRAPQPARRCICTPHTSIGSHPPHPPSTNGMLEEQ